MADEFEVKFHLRGPQALRRRLQQLGAELSAGRHLQRNWRFDLPDGSLSARGQVLRMRVDPAASLTFKRKTDQPERRLEFEFGVDDGQAAQEFLRALGFQQIGYYEKQREVFRLEGGRVMLDELPFGHFVELEGPSAAWLRRAADRLGLRWERQVPQSYLELFEALRRELALPIEQASFVAFADHAPVDLAALGLQDAGEGRAPAP